MEKRVIEILSDYQEPYLTCAIGNLALARGAIEAGVNGVFSYPGTPSTEISEAFKHIHRFQHAPDFCRKYPELVENPVHFEYSVNEKVALEKGIAFSIGNKAAMCVMKNVGLNVASDALMSITYQTIIGPLVIVTCDDPGCYSSSNEQDSRHWGPMASVPVFNPATPAEALVMARDAFRLSEKLRLPVIIRMTTRVSHTRGTLTYGRVNREPRAAGFQPLPEHINIPARTARAHQKLLEKLSDDIIRDYWLDHNRMEMPPKKTSLGIISSGVTSAYVTEILYGNDLAGKVAHLSLGMFWPFPEEQVLSFLDRGLTKVLVVEELDPLIEKELRALVQRHGLSVEILGKDDEILTATGEYNLEIVGKAIAGFTGEEIREAEPEPLPDIESLLKDLPPRPPTLCAGCPHRATFYALKLAVPREQPEWILCGDIGCFGLGALPPLKMMDTINHMGMSISMAQGLHEAFRHSREGRKTIALVGDGTFFHSGIPSLMNAVFTQADIMVVIFDNRTVGMTGHQENPGASREGDHRQLNIESLVRGLGVDYVDTITPFNLRDSFPKIEQALKTKGVSVIISKAPCIFLPEFLEEMPGTYRVEVDPSLCNTCANHEDEELHCSRCGSSRSNLSRARAKLLAEVRVESEAQLCPANICNHGFFHSILEGDYRSALEIVRDKMLFARTCGHICHRPCELFSGLPSSETIPIRALKKFVSQVEPHFNDFSGPLERAKKAAPKGKKVAIVGCGPAGLSAAYDLLQAGYTVEMYERENRPGGMLTYAIPDFRMDKSGLQAEMGMIEKMGVVIHYNTSLGKDIFLDQLRQDFDAVILAIGMSRSKKLDMVEQLAGKHQRYDALGFLKKYHTNTLEIKKSARFLVIGGGNSAMDVARTARRLHPENEVWVSCIEYRDNMPAFEEEIEETLQEGIRLAAGTKLADIVPGDENLGITLADFESGEPVEEFRVDYILTAIGQQGDPESLKGIDAGEMDEQYRLRTDPETGALHSGNLFAAGDLETGNHMSIIGAIASGKKAAAGVRKLLEAYPWPYEGLRALQRLNTQKPEAKTPKEWKQEDMLLADIARFDLFQACGKCNHCIENFGCPSLVRVNGKVQVDQTTCTRCGLCIDVCPNNAIHWVKIEEPVMQSV